MAKQAYRVRNWAQYNKALTERGSLTLWIDKEVEKKWYAAAQKQRRGRPFVYSELAITICSTLRLIYHLALRQTVGLVASIFALMSIELKPPSASSICRRQQQLKVQLNHQVRGKITLVIDATGLKIYGEGEWKVRQQGWSKRRMWRKLHIGIDVASQEIVMMELTDNRIGENKLLKPLLDQYPDGYDSIGGDTGYDSYENHEEVGRRGATSKILVQNQAKEREPPSAEKPPLVRDEIIRQMQVLGRSGWKEALHYHQRSLVETAFYRYKTILGGKMHGRLLASQKIEALLGCNILNRFTRLGLPLSEAVN
jgi:hypothetical protein